MNYKKIAKRLLALLFLSLVGGYSMFFKYDYTNFAYGEKPILNPLKGYAPLAIETDYELETSLVYAIINWNELEPQKGYYDFESFEQGIHMQKWKGEGKRFILRVMCDIPSEEGSLNIPNWLYEETKDGEWYDISYGKGYAPNYANPVFVEAHGELITALAKRYDSDPYVMAIQLGSLGHWGEWHVHDDLEIDFPKQEVADVYVNQYVSNFKNTHLQMRRPYLLAKANGMGLFNDVFGYEKGTYEWLDWIENGYISSQSDELMPSMKEVFESGLIGGEIASYESMEYYFSEGLSSMMMQLRDTHMSYVGPNSPIWLKGYEEEISLLAQELGYCFGVNQIGTRKIGNKLNVYITLENLNVAPMAENWMVRIYVLDKDDKLLSYKDIDAALNVYSKSKEISVWLSVPNEYQIAIGIIDPITDRPSVKMMNTEEIIEYVYKLK